MAGKKFSSLSKLALQPGSTIREDQDYLLRGRAVFEGDLAYLSTKPKRGDAHPKNVNVLLCASETTYLTLKKIRVECEYLGIDRTETPYFIEYVGSVGEEAIETHPNFASVIGGTPAAPLHNAKYDPDTNEFLGFPADAPNHSSAACVPTTARRSSCACLIGTLKHPTPARSVTSRTLARLTASSCPRTVPICW